MCKQEDSWKKEIMLEAMPDSHAIEEVSYDTDAQQVVDISQ